MDQAGSTCDLKKFQGSRRDQARIDLLRWTDHIRGYPLSTALQIIHSKLNGYDSRISNIFCMRSQIEGHRRAALCSILLSNVQILQLVLVSSSQLHLALVSSFLALVSSILTLVSSFSVLVSSILLQLALVQIYYAYS